MYYILCVRVWCLVCLGCIKNRISSCFFLWLHICIQCPYLSGVMFYHTTIYIYISCIYVNTLQEMSPILYLCCNENIYLYIYLYIREWSEKRVAQWLTALIASRYAVRCPPCMCLPTYIHVYIFLSLISSRCLSPHPLSFFLLSVAGSLSLLSLPISVSVTFFLSLVSLSLSLSIYPLSPFLSLSTPCFPLLYLSLSHYPFDQTYL